MCVYLFLCLVGCFVFSFFLVFFVVMVFGGGCCFVLVGLFCFDISVGGVLSTFF